MLQLDRLADEIMTSLGDPSMDTYARQEKLSYLDFRLEHLQPEVCYEEGINDIGSSSPTHRPAQLFIALRLNHLRLLTRFRSLSSASLAATQPKSAAASISAAEESVRLCRQARDHGFIPTILEATFTHFLMAAVSTLFLGAIYNLPESMPVNRRIFDDGLQLLEGVHSQPRGLYSCNQYSVANLRRLAERVQRVSTSGEQEGQSCSSDLMAPTSSLLPIQHTSSEPVFENDWSILQDNSFDASDLDILTGLVDQTWFHAMLPTPDSNFTVLGGGIVN